MKSKIFLIIFNTLFLFTIIACDKKSHQITANKKIISPLHCQEDSYCEIYKYCKIDYIFGTSTLSEDFCNKYSNLTISEFNNLSKADQEEILYDFELIRHKGASHLDFFLPIKKEKLKKYIHLLSYYYPCYPQLSEEDLVGSNILTLEQRKNYVQNTIFYGSAYIDYLIASSQNYDKNDRGNKNKFEIREGSNQTSLDNVDFTVFEDLSSVIQIEENGFIKTLDEDDKEYNPEKLSNFDTRVYKNLAEVFNRKKEIQETLRILERYKKHNCINSIKTD